MNTNNGLKILIVDDSPTSIQLFSRSLEGLAQLFFATNGPNAIDMAHQHQPDLILLDVNMPGLDSLDVCLSIKRTPKLADTAIIFVTSSNHNNNELTAFALGGIDFIAKPFHPEILKTRVKIHLALAQKTKLLEQAKTELAELVETLPAFVSYWSTNKVNLFCNDLSGKWFNIRADKLKGKTLEQLFNHDELIQLKPKIAAVLAGENQVFDMQLRLEKQGIIFAQVSLIAKTTFENREGFLVLISDISEKNIIGQTLYSEEEKLQSSLKSTGDGVIATDTQGNVTFINPIAQAMTQWQEAQALGKPIEQVMALVDEHSGSKVTNPIRKTLTSSHEVNLANSTKLIRKDGKAIKIEDSATPIFDHNDELTGALVFFHHASEAKAVALEKIRLTHYDALTNLPNRILLIDRIAQAIKNAKQRNDSAALITLDILQFKHINDLHGHNIGDLLLKKIAKTLTKQLTMCDTVSRHGGDEFAILLGNIEQVESVARFVNELVDTFNKPFTVSNLNFNLTINIGAAIYPIDGDIAETLFQHAESALFYAKKNPTSHCHFFSSEIAHAIDEKVSQEHDMKQALTNGEFEVFYQPKVDGRTNTINGAEALIRWIKPDGTIVPPNDFIPLAEETKLIIPLGEYVLEQACIQTKHWLKRYDEFTMAINISAVQFNNTLIGTLKSIINKHQLHPSHIELEITESILVDEERALDIVKQLKKLEIKLSMDDFGTGYSSLSYIKMFPLDVLKIDRSFVMNMLTDLVDASIVKTITQLSQSLNLELIAEGVECKAHIDSLLELGCYNFQGFYYSKPVTQSQFNHIMDKGNKQIACHH